MPEAAELLAAVARDGQIACKDAHRVAVQTGMSPQEMGRLVNRQTTYRFNRCQLGLFGYGAKGTAGYRIVQAAAYCPEAIVAAIEANVIDGCVPCLALWEVAAQFRYPRLGVANIVQALGLKVKPCQLGCF